MYEMLKAHHIYCRAPDGECKVIAALLPGIGPHASKRHFSSRCEVFTACLNRQVRDGLPLHTCLSLGCWWVLLRLLGILLGCKIVNVFGGVILSVLLAAWARPENLLLLDAGASRFKPGPAPALAGEIRALSIRMRSSWQTWAVAVASTLASRNLLAFSRQV